MLENRVPAPRAARVQHRKQHRARAALARIRVRRRHAMRYATTCGGIINDAALVSISNMSALIRKRQEAFS